MSDATTESTATYVYAPGIETRSRRLLIIGSVLFGIGVLSLLFSLVPAVGMVSILISWMLPVGLGAAVTGWLGMRIGYKNFRGFYVSPLVWGATAVLILPLLGLILAPLVTMNYAAIGGLATVAMFSLVISVVVSGGMVIVGFVKSGRRTLSDEALAMPLEPGGIRAFPILAIAGVWLFAPIGIVFGHLSLSQIKKRQLPVKSRSTAMIGLVFGYAITAGTVLIWVPSIVYLLTNRS